MRNDDLPLCFGKSWVADDDECDECELELDCREAMKERRYRPARKLPKNRRSTTAETNVEAMGITGIRAAPRHTGERRWQRILMNVGFGAASRVGVELSLFCEEERLRSISSSIKSDDDPEDA